MNDQRLTPFVWFDSQAEEATKFYVETFSKYFPNSKINNVVKYPEAAEEVSGKKAGTVMTVDFTLAGLNFTAINGGPYLKLSGGVSFVIDCENQEQVDYFWEKLGEGGEQGQCGWINRDKFGMTWQVVPSELPALVGNPDPVKADRAMKAMLQMTKLDIQALRDATEGK